MLPSARMSQEATMNPASAEEGEEAPPLQRVLLPSPLGSLGLDFRGETITRFVIVPERKERKHYHPLADFDRSDFLDEALGRLLEYFAGARKNLQLDFDISESGLDPFAMKVLTATREIPYGETRTYQKLASFVGASDSYRLVRSILVSNPLPVLLPCHRVVPRKSGPGSYVGGTKKKDWLLKMEKKALAASES